LQKHFYPEPRLELGRWLAEKRLATAMMDLSDGLSSDLRRMCEASGVGAVVDAGRLPTVQVAERERARGIDPLKLALHGGDDYELLFAVAARNAARVPGSVGRVKITAIGEITRGHEIKLVDEEGPARSLPAGGWDPFR
jgi:thiamine-monophosphate kinase